MSGGQVRESKDKSCAINEARGVEITSQFFWFLVESRGKTRTSAHYNGGARPRLKMVALYLGIPARGGGGSGEASGGKAHRDSKKLTGQSNDRKGGPERPVGSQAKGFNLFMEQKRNVHAKKFGKGNDQAEAVLGGNEGGWFNL